MRMFKHFALVALLAMFLTGIGGALGGAQAQAMTLGDLVGTYRETEVGNHGAGDWILKTRGAVLRFEQTDDDDYVIKVVKPGSGSLFGAGDSVVTDMYVMDGVIHCNWNCQSTADPSEGIMEVYNGGQMLKIYWESHPAYYIVLRKI